MSARLVGLFSALVLGGGIVVEAQEPQNLDRICKEVLCRDAAPIRVRVPGKPVVEVLFPRMIVFAGGMGNVVPGETVYLEADVKNGVLVNVHAVPMLKTKSKTIVFKLEPLKDQGMEGHTLLTVTNPFSKTLRYHAGIRAVGDDVMKKTSVCGVTPAGHSFEHWPEPIVLLGFKDLRLVDPSSPDASDCVE